MTHGNLAIKYRAATCCDTISGLIKLHRWQYSWRKPGKIPCALLGTRGYFYMAPHGAALTTTFTLRIVLGRYRMLPLVGNFPLFRRCERSFCHVRHAGVPDGTNQNLPPTFLRAHSQDRSWSFHLHLRPLGARRELPLAKGSVQLITQPIQRGIRRLIRANQQSTGSASRAGLARLRSSCFRRYNCRVRPCRNPALLSSKTFKHHDRAKGRRRLGVDHTSTLLLVEVRDRDGGDFVLSPTKSLHRNRRKRGVISIAIRMSIRLTAPMIGAPSLPRDSRVDRLPFPRILPDEFTTFQSGAVFVRGRRTAVRTPRLGVHHFTC